MCFMNRGLHRFRQVSRIKTRPACPDIGVRSMKLPHEPCALTDTQGTNSVRRIRPKPTFNTLGNWTSYVAARRIISALGKRRLLQTADHLVRDPTVDGGANSRS